MSVPTLVNKTRAAFASRFGGDSTVFAAAPGRVELLGNHTDHNGGLVLAAAIDRFTVVAGRGTAGGVGRVRSLNVQESDEFACDRHSLKPEEAHGWSRYVRGVYWAMTESVAGRGGFEAVIAGEVPLGAGLSSSASLQAALGVFLIAAGAVESPRAERGEADLMALARRLQRGENEFVGVASGLLDQFTALFGEAGHALMLDCRDLSHERLPLGSSPPAIVVCDSMTSRRLADGMYNRRRAECESVVESFRRRGKAETVRSLRDVTLEELNDAWNDLDPIGRLRARHVLRENERVKRGAEALRAGDVKEFGRLMSASHASSRDDFSNSSTALDALIEAAEAAPGFLGGKLSGAGWAGCTVNLVLAEKADEFVESVSNEYQRRAGQRPEIHVCHAAPGARPISPNGEAT